MLSPYSPGILQWFKKESSFLNMLALSSMAAYFSYISFSPFIVLQNRVCVLVWVKAVCNTCIVPNSEESYIGYIMEFLTEGFFLGLSTQKDCFSLMQWLFVRLLEKG